MNETKVAHEAPPKPEVGLHCTQCGYSHSDEDYALRSVSMGRRRSFGVGGMEPNEADDGAVLPEVPRIRP
jgi:hypothetical protein